MCSEQTQDITRIFFNEKNYSLNITMQILTIKTSSDDYPVYIGHNLLDEKTDLLSAHIGKNRVVIVTSERIAPLYLQLLKSKLTDYPLQEIILPDGEQWKNWQNK